MIRKLLYFLSIILIIFITIIFYLSLFGINTDKFNDIIIKKIKENNPKISINLKKINLLLNPLDFTIELKTKDPKVRSEDIEIQIEEVSTEYNIFSFLKKEFGLNNVYLKTKKNSIKNIVKFIRTQKDNAQLFIIQKLAKDGEGEFTARINFDERGKIKDDFKIDGKIKNFSIISFDKNKIEKISTDFTYAKGEISLQNLKLQYLDLKFLSKNILIKKNGNFYNVGGTFENKNLSLSPKTLNFVFKEKIFEELVFSSENRFKFQIDKKYKISELSIQSKINLDHASLIYKNKKIKKFFPEYEDILKLNKHEIDIDYGKKIKLVGDGKIKINENQDNISYKFDIGDNLSKYELNIIFNEIPIKIDLINFSKDKGSKANFNIKLDSNKKNFFIDKLTYASKDLQFGIDRMQLNNELNIQKFEEISISFKDNKQLNNDLNIKNINNQYFVKGNNFVLDKIIEEVLIGKRSNEKTKIFDESKKIFNLNINKLFIDKEHNLFDLNGKIEIKGNEIISLDLASEFTENRNVSLSIKKTGNQKITTFYSQLAKPFVKKFKFVKGFEGGQIDLTSIKENNTSTSVLKIYDFKLKELPALTKVLTLASLQGISDLLTGEGVRFDEFEMLFSNKDKILTIEEIYSIGPAISILMEGYVQKDDLISLKGTLVPATTINKFVANIPVLGEILVGKKTGEGVFGVSFKIKGPPENFKTTVNPIKTLTPRFITRTLEKIKKSN